MAFIEDKQRQLQQIEAQIGPLEQRYNNEKKIMDDFRAMMATPGRKDNVTAPNVNPGAILPQLNMLKKQAADLKSQIRVYQSYGGQEYTGSTGEYQTFKPLDTVSSARNVERMYETKQANIGEAKRIIGATEQAIGTENLDAEVNKINQQKQEVQSQIDNLENQARGKLGGLWDQLKDSKHYAWTTAGKVVFEKQYPGALSAFNEYAWKIDPLRKQIAPLDNQLNELNTIKQQKQSEAALGQKDITAAKGVISEQEKGMDDVRIQRERYMRALQQGRQRNQLYGKSNEYLKALS